MQLNKFYKAYLRGFKKKDILGDNILQRSDYNHPKSMYLFFLFPLIIVLVSLAPKDKAIMDSDRDISPSSNEYFGTHHSTLINEADVTGFYSGRGLYNASNATIDLYFGGSFIMEDPFLPEGRPAYGKWVLSRSNINFYMDGRLTFSASVSLSGNEVRGIILKGRLWEKLR